MKYIILICDGMADYPLEELGNKTPLQAADTPNMDTVAREGRGGLAETVPPGYKPGSDVANLSILGYDPDLYYSGGRGLMEAASIGVELDPHDLAMRANIITVEDGRIKDYSAGQITSEESAQLIEAANKELAVPGIELYPGVSYRNLVVLRGCDLEPEDLSCSPPHDHIGEIVDKLLIKGSEKGREWTLRLNDMMLRSKPLFESHPVNEKRREEGKPPANMLWFWGPGKKKREMPTMKERFGTEGVVITGIDLIKGLGILAGLKPLNVEGATAYFDTNFEGKADAAIKALEDVDIAVIHVEAPDEAGHEGSVEEKVRAIENIDHRLLSRLLNRLDNFRILLLPDHYTPISVRTHVRGPVPFSIMGPGIEQDKMQRFDEDSAKTGAYGLQKGHHLINLLVSGSYPH